MGSCGIALTIRRRKGVMSMDRDYFLRWDQHEENRTSTFRSLWENSDFLDVTIACDDDQIDAHKVILSAASPFFRTLLKRNPHSHPLLYLRGTTKKQVQALLEFIYSGESQVEEVELKGFIALANSLQVKGLGIGEFEEHEDKENILNIEKDTQPIIKYSVKNGIKDTENLFDVEFSEEKIETEDDITGLSFIHVASETSGLKQINFQNLSEFVAKSGVGWNCTECQYSAKKRDHILEHVEKHIEGHYLECKFCTKTFSRSRTLRNHLNKCSK